MYRSTLLGTTTGAAIMFGFGILWLLLGLLGGRPSPAWLWLSLLVAGIILGASILTLGLRVSRLPRDPGPLSAEQVATDRALGRRFNLITGIEMGAIFLALVVLNVIHNPGYISSVIALIVGVHFFPLAPLFKSPSYYVTGLLGCAIAIAGLLVVDAVSRQELVGLSFGLLLWATAAWKTRTGVWHATGVSDLPG